MLRKLLIEEDEEEVFFYDSDDDIDKMSLYESDPENEDSGPIYDTDGEEESFEEINFVAKEEKNFMAENEILEAMIEEITFIDVERRKTPIRLTTAKIDVSTYQQNSGSFDPYERNLFSKVAKENIRKNYLDQEGMFVSYLHARFKLWKIFTRCRPWDDHGLHVPYLNVVRMGGDEKYFGDYNSCLKCCVRVSSCGKENVFRKSNIKARRPKGNLKLLSCGKKTLLEKVGTFVRELAHNTQEFWGVKFTNHSSLCFIANHVLVKVDGEINSHVKIDGQVKKGEVIKVSMELKACFHCHANVDMGEMSFKIDHGGLTELRSIPSQEGGNDTNTKPLNQDKASWKLIASQGGLDDAMHAKVASKSHAWVISKNNNWNKIWNYSCLQFKNNFYWTLKSHQEHHKGKNDVFLEGIKASKSFILSLWPFKGKLKTKSFITIKVGNEDSN